MEIIKEIFVQLIWQNIKKNINQSIHSTNPYNFGSRIKLHFSRNYLIVVIKEKNFWIPKDKIM